MAVVYALAQQKGGVGKTTVTFNLGAALAERGKKVLLVDLDPQGALTDAFGVKAEVLTSTIYDLLMLPRHIAILWNKPNMDLLPATIDLAGAEVELYRKMGWEHTLRDKLARYLDGYDAILIDCPPSLGLLTSNALVAADRVIIPVQCGYLAYRGLHLLLNTIEDVQSAANPTLTWKILPTFSDNTNHSKEIYAALYARYKDHLLGVGHERHPLGVAIPRRVALADAIGRQRTIFEDSPNSELCDLFRALAEVINGS